MRIIFCLIISLGLASSLFAETTQQFKQQIDQQTNLPGPPQLASVSIKIQNPVVYLYKDGKNAKVIMRFVNTDNNGHVVIAAYSPVDKQTQLRTVVKIHAKPLDVQIHSFSLQLNNTTWLGVKQKHIALVDLSRTLQPGNTTPITVIFRDGSFETVDAKIKS